jgi:dihydroorotate dehydrogenase electron transfer subunit
MVYLERGDLLLPRPISICDADTAAGAIELVYQVVGKGTAALAEMSPGQNVKILGPLGNGFGISNCHAAIVGGGIGVPPLYFLAKMLAKCGSSADIFLGFRDTPILIDKFRELASPLNGEVHIATESGNVGQRGYVTEILATQNEKCTEKYTEIFTCGPAPMLRVVAEISLVAKIPCQVSVEERMACGLGTCVGCVVKVGENYVRVCTDGPVFFR